MFLPVHAAGIHHGSRQERCSDYVVSSYTPTVTALHKAQLTSPILLRDQVAILVIAEKDAPDMPPLSMIREEVKTITDVARQSGIVVNHAASTLSTTVSEAAAGLSTAQMVHFACHGLQNVGDPLESGFHLHDGRLTVSQLMQLNLKSAFLAILSACETARGDWKQPDQTVHLAAAMLFSGFRHVLGTMWSVY
jgi:CHAT domain-containing protein